MNIRNAKSQAVKTFFGLIMVSIAMLSPFKLAKAGNENKLIKIYVFDQNNEKIGPYTLDPGTGNNYKRHYSDNVSFPVIHCSNNGRTKNYTSIRRLEGYDFSVKRENEYFTVSFTDYEIEVGDKYRDDKCYDDEIEQKISRGEARLEAGAGPVTVTLENGKKLEIKVLSFEGQ